MIDKYRALKDEIEEKIPFEVNMSVALVDCRDIKAKLMANCQFFITTICEKIFAHTNTLRSKLVEDVQKITEELHKSASDADELERIQIQIDQIEKEGKISAEKKFAEMVDWVNMLYDNDYEIIMATLNNVNKAAE